MDLSNNLVSTLSKGNLETLTSLKTLILDGNSITDLTELAAIQVLDETASTSNLWQQFGVGESSAWEGDYSVNKDNSATASWSYDVEDTPNTVFVPWPEL